MAVNLKAEILYSNLMLIRVLKIAAKPPPNKIIIISFFDMIMILLDRYNFFGINPPEF